MRIFTPDTKCDFIGCDVPNISVEKFASNACHAIRTQFAEREHVSRLFEWVIDTQKTVTISRPFVYAAPEYGKLSSWDRITERADATIIAASGSHVRASDGSVRIDDEHSRRLPVGDAHHRIDFDWRAQFGGQRVIALNGIPAAAVAERSSIFDEHHPASANDCETFRIVQGYGKPFRR